MARSKLPEARICPSGLKAREVTQFSWPRTTVGAALGWRRSHSRTVLSALPAARVCPSGLKATDRTAFSCPRSTVGAALGWRRSHSCTVLSALPEARVCPSGLKVREVTQFSWPRTTVGAAFYINDQDNNINFTTTPSVIAAVGLPAFFSSTNPPPGWR